MVSRIILIKRNPNSIQSKNANMVHVGIIARFVVVMESANIRKGEPFVSNAVEGKPVYIRNRDLDVRYAPPTIFVSMTFRGEIVNNVGRAEANAFTTKEKISVQFVPQHDYVNTV